MEKVAVAGLLAAVLAAAAGRRHSHLPAAHRRAAMLAGGAGGSGGERYRVSRSEAVVGGMGAERGRIYWFAGPEGEVSTEEALGLLRTSAAFRGALVQVLREAPYPAYFWETPPVSSQALLAGRGGGPFQMALISSEELDGVGPDTSTFSEYFEGCREGSVVSFTNLGGDAVLVAPCPAADPEGYPHVAQFVRKAPSGQVDELFRRVGMEVEKALADRGPHPTWVSTSGLGVYWLHVRLDTAPKYYQHGPYKRWPWNAMY